MRIGVLLLMLWPLSAPAADRSETLAELRAALSGLQADVLSLKEQLAPARASAPSLGRGGSVLSRLSAIERELQRQTSKVEELEYRIDKLVRNGSRQLSDLELRLCVLEPDCSPVGLEAAPSFGGTEAAPSGPRAVAGQLPSALTLEERALFDRARAAFDAGQFDEAIRDLALHVERFPGGPLAAEAELLRGEALEAQRELPGAARAYLESFSTNSTGRVAPRALLSLGRVLAELGQANEACATLDQVQARFPEAPEVRAATARRAALDCP